MTWRWIVALGVASVCVVAVAWWKRDDPRWRPLLPGVVGTALGLVVSIAAYLWMFEEPEQCTGRSDFACMLNANQGMLTFLAIGLTVVGLWVAAITRQAEMRSAARAARVRADTALDYAAEELHHNLLHVALCYDEKRELIARPQLTDTELCNLCDPAHRLEIDPEIIRSAGVVLRHHDTLEAATASGDDEEYAEAIRDYVSRSLRLLVLLQQFYPDAVAETLNAPGMQDIRAVAKNGAFAGAFDVDDGLPGIHDLRSKEIPVICWFGTAEGEGIKAFPQWRRFRDMTHPPH